MFIAQIYLLVSRALHCDAQLYDANYLMKVLYVLTSESNPLIMHHTLLFVIQTRYAEAVCPRHAVFLRTVIDYK